VVYSEDRIIATTQGVINAWLAHSIQVRYDGTKALVTAAPGATQTEAVTSAETNTTNSSATSSHGLLPGAIAGIVVGGVVGILIIGGIVTILMRRRRDAKWKRKSFNASTAPYFKGELDRNTIASRSEHITALPQRPRMHPIYGHTPMPAPQLALQPASQPIYQLASEGYVIGHYSHGTHLDNYSLTTVGDAEDYLEHDAEHSDEDGHESQQKLTARASSIAGGLAAGSSATVAAGDMESIETVQRHKRGQDA
jgi:hypothetical protein